jgi:5-methylcytosine-specific restriction endonuclease McrBC regulatory subunit McrC
MRHGAPLRVSEWSSVSVSGQLDSEQCAAIEHAAETWRGINGLSAAPLSFSGSHGDTLCACQYVGVVEVFGATVEIYPKLDKRLLSLDRLTSDALADSVMQNLLWMLEVSGHMDVTEADTAHLEEHPVSFYDIFAYLMARNLREELGSGIPHAYQTRREAIPAVKGRIDIIEQVTTQWSRMDRVSCIWDEFTADIPLNRLFKSACRVLEGRVTNPVVSQLLGDCQTYLEPVTDVDPNTALRDIEFFRWDRSNVRLKTSFDMAIRLLAGTGYSLGTGSSETFVFLMDMNALFEAYAAAVLAAAFGSEIETQRFVGRLFAGPERLSQYPDYLWGDAGRRWIGDAKYKHLAKGQEDALSFRDLPDEDSDSSEQGTRADRVLSPTDVRQLTVYAELLRKREQLPNSPAIMILYPFVGTGRFESTTARTWNGSLFRLTPVRVSRCALLSEALPSRCVCV